MSTWIPVTPETMPDSGARVLAVWPDGYMSVVWRVRGLWAWSEYGLEVRVAPSHWMPLPAAPGGEG